MKYQERRPPPALRPYVECVWAISGPRVATTRPPERVVPDGCTELIVHLGNPFARKVGARWVTQPRVFLAGTLSRPWLLRPGRRVDTVGIRFRAGETRGLLPVSMAGASDRELPLSGIVGRAAAQALLASLRGAGTTAHRFSAAEQWLARRLAETPPRRGTSTDAVARLNAVLATLEDAERTRAVDLALDAGYFDQAHLLRDFRLLAGRTPRSGRESDGQMARHFTDPRRLNALLAGE